MWAVKTMQEMGIMQRCAEAVDDFDSAQPAAHGLRRRKRPIHKQL